MELQVLFLFLFMGVIAAYIFFLVTQSNLLKDIQPLNRKISPGEVWLQLIPVFNLVWVFIVVIRISDSIRQEFRDRQQNAFLGLADSAIIEEAGGRPTYSIGLTYALLITSYGLISIARPLSATGIFGPLTSLAALICWIIYWVKLQEYRNKLRRLLV